MSLRDSQSKLTLLFKSVFLNAQTYGCEDFDSGVSASDHSQTDASMGSNNTLFESVPILMDTECLLLLGLFYCQDRENLKAQIFFSLLRSNSPQKASELREDPDELNCMSEAIENTTFKMCVLSSLFVEYHALPPKAGKTEVKLLQMGYTLRTSAFFEVF